MDGSWYLSISLPLTQPQQAARPWLSRRGESTQWPDETLIPKSPQRAATRELIWSEAKLPPNYFRELVAHLRQNGTQLREEWVVRISGTRLLTAMTKEEIFAEATSVYDSYVEALETETFEALQAYSRNLSERIIPRGVETH